MTRAASLALASATLCGACTTGQLIVPTPPESTAAATVRGAAQPARVVHSPPAPESTADFRLRYDATIESRSASTWDITTWSGAATLALDEDGVASLRLSVQAHGVGGSTGPIANQAEPERAEHRDPEMLCGYHGEWRDGPEGLMVELTRDEGDAFVHACRPDAEPGAMADAEGPWVLHCAHQVALLPDGAPTGPRTPESVLGCRTRGGTPWVWALVQGDGPRLRLGDTRTVHARSEREESDVSTPRALESVLDRVPREWLAPPERP